MNKGELVTLCQEYLENEETSYVANIPLFIRLAEESIYRQLQLPDLRKTHTTAMTASDPYYTLPTDYLSSYHFMMTTGTDYVFLLNKDINFIREAYPDPATTGTPRYYAQFDDTKFIVGPTPAGNYAVELLYFYIPTSLADGADGDETWLSTNAESALLFGTLLQGYIYMKGDQDMINSYKEQFAAAVGDLKIIVEGRARKDTYRIPDRRQST